MRMISVIGVLIAAVATTVALAAVPSSQATAERQTTLSFNGDEYLHRWSKAGQHEFTRKGEEDLSKWNSMMTLNVHNAARTGRGLVIVYSKRSYGDRAAEEIGAWVAKNGADIERADGVGRPTMVGLPEKPAGIVVA